MKASDIPDLKMMEAIRNNPRYSGIGTSRFDIQQRFPDFPEKVVRAKLHALLRRGLIFGCCCGCRGDFTFTEKGNAFYEAG